VKEVGGGISDFGSLEERVRLLKERRRTIGNLCSESTDFVQIFHSSLDIHVGWHDSYAVIQLFK
jgi:hypothetical protein